MIFSLQRTGIIGLCALFALPALSKSPPEPPVALPDPLGAHIEALLDEAAQNAEPAERQATQNCHIAYTAAYETAARKSWPRRPSLPPGTCPDRTGKPAQVVCTPAGRWKDLAIRAESSPAYKTDVEANDPPIEYTCRLHPLPKL